jgi:glucose/arabinose dehydrogenase
MNATSRVAVLIGLAAICAVASAEDPVAGDSAPPPKAPFTDYRYQAPGKAHRITVDDLPAPYATRSAGKPPQLIARPAGVQPLAPAGFTVNLFAEALDEPRVLRVAPNGDVFLAESGAGRIRLFRGIGADGRPQLSEIYATGLHRPYGIAFYPPGPEPQWVYVGDTDEIVRFAYHAGDLHSAGAAEHVAALPDSGGHWTRDLRFSKDGKVLFVGVGSASNADDPDENPEENNRAAILALDPDGAKLRTYATGMRNPSGLAIDPASGQLWAAVNERDGLGDDLVPDYLTAVRAGGFYGWPWWYLGAHPDPRLKGKHAQDRERVLVPDVLIQPHSAPLQLEFYTAARFPAAYRGDIFATSHGSWNRSVRTGYAVLRIHEPYPGVARTGYEDFLTGFVLPDGRVWGRPVGITVATDGSLLVSDDGSGAIWRVDYTGPAARR